MAFSRPSAAYKPTYSYYYFHRCFYYYFSPYTTRIDLAATTYINLATTYYSPPHYRPVRY